MKNNTAFQKWLNENYRQSVYPDYLLPKDCDYPLIDIRDATTKFYTPVIKDNAEQPDTEQIMMQDKYFNPAEQQGDKFTGGEWIVKSASINSSHGVRVMCDEKKIAQIFSPLPLFAEAQAEAEANARLIAEAKNMYYALKTCNDFVAAFKFDKDVLSTCSNKELLGQIQSILNRVEK